MPPKAPESKAAKAAKALAGGKKGKKKWSKGKMKEKANNQVLFEQSTYDKLLAEVPKYKMITTAVLCDRLRITCSLARKGIAILQAKGLIKPLVSHAALNVYTNVPAA
ncbi:ribosomal protein S25, partial [Ostreococcus tauri]